MPSVAKNNYTSQIHHPSTVFWYFIWLSTNVLIKDENIPIHKSYNIIENHTP